jgi:hypothetical protein
LAGKPAGREAKVKSPQRVIPRFERQFFQSGEPFMRIGDGEIGGKAAGLVAALEILEKELADDRFAGLLIDIPVTTIVTTEVFDAFKERNGLHDLALSGAPDERIAHGFIGGELPVEFVGDLRALVEQTGGAPLAVRSSSLLEDALEHPFAGVYETKMIPNNQPDPSVRFKKLAEAIKFVYASTFFGRAVDYIRAVDRDPAGEKMAVIIQEVVGEKHGDRFYPHLSGVCRSYNYYRTGRARPEEGVVNLALGLGKMIVDGGVSWSYSPAHPKAPPPFATVEELMKSTQLKFWAVNMGTPPAFDPIAETEYLTEEDLQSADYDDTLRYVASTYDVTRGRLSPGTGVRGARVLNFSPLLEMGDWSIQPAIRRLMEACESALGAAVEIEFAVTFPRRGRGDARFAFLQVRPMLVSQETVDVDEDLAGSAGVLLYSDRVMGNGRVNDIRDVLYVKPESFESRLTPEIAGQLAEFNRTLHAAGKPYLLIGFGRWGSSDPWLGIPVNWSQISNAKVIVESTMPDMNVEPSQGAHFFHNISSFQVSYFTAHHDDRPGIDWGWLEQQQVVNETELVRHVSLDTPLDVRIDGRSGRGMIKYRYAG